MAEEAREMERTLTKEIGAALGYKMVGELNSERLQGPQGERLNVKVSWRDTSKVNIDAYVPSELVDFRRYDDRGSNEIYVSIARGVPTIIKEIKRRLLPDYLVRLKGCQERKAQDDARKAVRSDTLNRLKNALGLWAVVEEPRNTRDEAEKIVVGWRRGNPGVEIQVGHNGKHAQITVKELTIDEADTMARFLGETFNAKWEAFKYGE